MNITLRNASTSDKDEKAANAPIFDENVNDSILSSLEEILYSDCRSITDDIFWTLNGLNQDCINFYYEKVHIPDVDTAKEMNGRTVGQNDQTWKSVRQVSVIYCSIFVRMIIFHLTCGHA